MIVIQVLVPGMIISGISIYTPKCGLDDSHKDDFYDSLNSVVRKSGENKILVVARGCIGHVGSNPEDYEHQHGGYGYGVRNKEGERFLSFKQL